MAKSRTQAPEQEVPADDDREALLEGMTEEDDQVEESPAEEEQAEENTEETPDAQEPQSTEQTEPQSDDTPDLLSALRELGVDVSDEQQAQQMVLQALQDTRGEQARLQQRLEEQEELAEYGRQFLRDQRQQREAEEQAKQAASQEQAPEAWWAPPQFDFSTLEKYRDVTIGEDGTPQIGWKKGTPREIVESAEAYQEYIDKWATDLVQRPHEVLPKIIEQEFDRLFSERIQQRDEAAELGSFASQVMEANSDWMYTQDSRGHRVLTDEGERMAEILQWVSESGVSDPRRQWELAVAQYDYQNRLLQQQHEQSQQQTEDTVKQRKKEHTQKSLNSSRNRTGTVPKPAVNEEEDQNIHLTPGQQLVQQLQADGMEL